ncbi:MAG: hypothetical protein FWE68_03780 [Defluviitaleaceae bacterium]|nr:hypothetical protein [Defluviitaleaceae bacterium]
MTKITTEAELENEKTKTKFNKFIDWVNADAGLPVYEEEDAGHEAADDDPDDIGERILSGKSDAGQRTEDFFMDADEEFDYSAMFEDDEEYASHAEAAAALVDGGGRRLMLRVGIKEKFRSAQLFLYIGSIALTTAIAGVLLLTLSHMPTFGDPANPTNNEVYARYIEQGIQDVGIPNIVAAIILDYRAFDTLGEAFVLYTALIAIIMLVRTSCGSKFILTEAEQPLMLRFMVMLICPFILVYGIYILFNGHLTPGGGFSGGAILGSALSLYAIAFGAEKVRKIFSFNTMLIAVGGALLFYSIGKGYSFIMGASGLAVGIPLGTPGNLLSGGLVVPLNFSVGIVVGSTVYGIYALFSEGEV